MQEEISKSAPPAHEGYYDREDIRKVPQLATLKRVWGQ
jgi:hypothetical protein